LGNAVVRRKWVMKIFGDLNFLDRGDDDAADAPKASAPSPQLVAHDALDESPDGIDLSDELEAEGGADHYAAAVRFYLRGQ
jgi:hypothetical protein